VVGGHLDQLHERTNCEDVMLTASTVVRSPVIATPRVLQVRGMFDLPAEAHSEMSWNVALPLDQRPWNVGLIVGPSGSGKSTIARRFWPERMAYRPLWPRDRSVLDAFPVHMPVKEVVGLLSSVGFSSPPAWLRPYEVLSTGQQFRAGLARLLAEQPDLAVQDEFTSALDRTVARIGAHALAKVVRRRGQKFVALTCHEDVEAWLDPDWVYRPALASNQGSDAREVRPSNLVPRSSVEGPGPKIECPFAWRCLRQRPPITLRVCRIGREAWQIFKHHHYLSGALSPAAVCFGAYWERRLVAFSAWINALSKRGGKREHRTVTLPDYQGAGIGQALAATIASLWKALGYRASSTTTHPAYVAARLLSPLWRMIRPPSLAGGDSRIRHARTRLTAGFEYVGPPGDVVTARRLIKSL
jgi:GNAT superfamily N-acetyltransferase